MCSLHVDLYIILSTEMSVARVRSRYRGYSPETLQRILQLIRNRQMTAYIAAKAYAILKTTIVDKVAGRVPVVCRSDPDPVLSSD